MMWQILWPGNGPAAWKWAFLPLPPDRSPVLAWKGWLPFVCLFLFVCFFNLFIYLFLAALGLH